MIALISFERDLAIPKEEANSLNLNYDPTIVVGKDYNGYVQKKDSSHHFYDEMEERPKEGEDAKEGETEWFFGDKKVQHYYRLTRYPDGYVYIRKDGHLVDLQQFALKCKHRFYIEKSVKSPEPTVSNIQLILTELEDKASQINKTVDILKQQSFNQKVNVHVGGGLIATYNELLLKEDICTDVLQTELNNGWRIIAVCVQPDQRRPDYILGRYNPKLEVEEKKGASR